MQPIIDDRTTHADLPLPHPENWQEDDVLRLRLALYAIDQMLSQISDVALSLIDDQSVTLDRTWSGHRIDTALQQLTTAIGQRQAGAANLTALAALAGAANRLPYFTDAGAMALATLTSAARDLLAAASKEEQRAALELGTAALAAVMTGPASTNNALVPRALGWALRDKQVAIPAATGAVVLDLATASVFDLTLTGATTLSLANVPALPAGEVLSVIVRVRQGATAFALTWWGGITWLEPTTPSAPTANKTREFVVSFAGAAWLGRKGAGN